MPVWAAWVLGAAIAFVIAAPSGIRLLAEVREDRKAAKAEAEWARRQRERI